MMRIETHCHSYHSFDSEMSMAHIVEACKRWGIGGIVVCDHDTCGITPEEEALFADNGIRLFKAIEFTTKTDAHIIGVSPQIATLQKERGHYTVGELTDALQSIEATIIIPHPSHGTGIIGNGMVSDADKDKAFRAAHFVECDNYRYGKTVQDVTGRYPHLRAIMGSDAHSSKNVGAYLNEVDGAAGDDLQSLLGSGDLRLVRSRQLSWRYWAWREVKKSAPYQALLRLFPKDMRRAIKNKLIDR